MPRASRISAVRAAASFAGGALIALVGARLLPPIVAQARGKARMRTGGDPFETLMDDHRAIMSHLDAMVESSDSEAFSRVQHLLRLKRRLGAHAMAEEDIVYPALREQAALEGDAAQLYQEHAEIKVLLYKLEQAPKSSEQWHEHATALRTLIEGHIHQEEDVDFPKLRAALDNAALSELASKIEREKALLL
jgi:iron-sulfur cluster repair protein YtfE (RIC family)